MRFLDPAGRVLNAAGDRCVTLITPAKKFR
jgi:hypothetical protein